MSIYDYITPSEQAAALGLLVKRVRRNTEAGNIPVLVVEGTSDEAVFRDHRASEQSAVFAAGTRTLVEQLLRHLRTQPVAGCECIFLIDCDGLGKTPNLAGEESLLVTQACDMEADLVSLGVAKRTARRFLPSDEVTDAILERAAGLAMSVSVVRRAAHGASISMKKAGKQLRLRDVSDDDVIEIESRSPSPADALDVIALEMGWNEQVKEVVAARLSSISPDFERACLGKDALDALHALLVKEGSGEVRGWSCDHFHQVVRGELQLDDFSNWEVGRRLYAWQEKSGCSLLPARE